MIKRINTKEVQDVDDELKNVNFEMRDIVLIQKKYEREYDKMLRKELKEIAKKGEVYNGRW